MPSIGPPSSSGPIDRLSRVRQFPPIDRLSKLRHQGRGSDGS